MKKILGISAFYHDAAACIVVGSKVIAAAQEERFTRIKHDPEFPVQAISYCLKEANLHIDDLDAVVFYDKPLLKFERLMETYYAFAPRGLRSFLSAIPVWIKEKLFLKKQIYQGLKQIEPYQKKQLKLLFTEHHLAHAASSFYPSRFKEAALLTMDGVGEWCTASIGVGKGNAISFLREMKFPHSLGLLYSSFTYFLGFKVNSGEYKLMGLAPYGEPEAIQTAEYIKQIRDKLVAIKEDGSIWMDPEFFSYPFALRMVNDQKWEALFGIKKRSAESEILQSHCNLAYAIQHVTEEIVLKMASEAKKLTGLDSICLAGGVALNCVANGKLIRSGLFKEVYIQPASGDAGGAIGAALSASHLYFNEERIPSEKYDSLQGSYLGPAYSASEITAQLKELKAVFIDLQTEEEIAKETSKRLGQGEVVGWFQGRMEFGPRALGNRSILGDARNPAMQQKINLKIKYRESFRPFAPAVLEEKRNDYFDLEPVSPYMLLVAPVQEKRRKSLPADFYNKPYMERLQIERSDIQSITHVDFSARVQTVNADTNPRFYSLLKAMERTKGEGVVINTSFNVRGEPIVCSPKDAYACFMRTEMDTLVLGNLILNKKDQPIWNEKENWKTKFKLD